MESIMLKGQARFWDGKKVCLILIQLGDSFVDFQGFLHTIQVMGQGAR